MDDKGIASVDLLLASLIALIVIGSFVSLISSETGYVQTSELGKARILGERVATTINTVYTNGNGYSANLTLPTDFNYTILVQTNGSLRVTYNSQNIYIKVIPKSINTVTMNPGQRYRISNVNGTITFTLI